ncbi:MAG: hypothetical protein RML40_06125 [Bacteroidota bacterium]|nr:hypothetical protein [Bacteroidota bacterium]
MLFTHSLLWRKAIYVLLIFGVLVLCEAGCIVVMQKSKQSGQSSVSAKPEEKPVRQLPSKPSILMSDEVVRSELGDMVSVLPLGWSLVNIETNLPVQVFSVAVNPHYTAGLIYSVLRKEEGFDRIYQKDGLVGIGRISASRRDTKMRNIKRIGDFEEVQVGTKRFCLYRYTTDNGATLNRVAVFRSSFGNYYECTLADLTFTGRKLVSYEEMEEIYASVLAAIDF